jgi:hypothetical protein
VQTKKCFKLIPYSWERKKRKFSGKMREQQKLLEHQIKQIRNMIENAEIGLKNTEYQTKSIKANYLNQCKIMETAMDRYKNRIRAIQEYPSINDNSLVNLALLLTKKSKNIDKAILQMRQSIKEFNDLIKNTS